MSTRIEVPGSGGGGGGAPTNAEYLLGTANGSLPNGRVVTDSPTVSWDLTVSGIVKANVIRTLTRHFLFMGA
jgi:hypothetical protein